MYETVLAITVLLVFLVLSAIAVGMIVVVQPR